MNHDASTYDRLDQPKWDFYIIVFLITAAWFLCLPRACLGAAPDLFSSSLSGQWDIKTWETGDGLPDNSSTAMVQTRDGYLWSGTFNGLVRFDGVKFTVFDQSNTPQLPGNQIVNIYLDRHERLWLSTERGIIFLRSGKWSPIFDAGKGWTGDFVRTFAEGPGKFFVTSFNGKVFQWEGERFRELPSPPGEPDRGYFGHVDQQGDFYVAQHGFIGKWDGQNWNSTLSPSEFISEDGGGAGSGRDGAFWLFNRQQLARLEKGQISRTISLESLPFGGFWSLYEDSRGDIWIATYNNGWIRVSPSGEFEHRTSTNGLSSASVRYVVEDREGTYWVGTSGGGLMRIRPRVLSSFNEKDGLPSPVVHAVAVTSANEILVGTYGGGLARLTGTHFTPIELPAPLETGANIECLLEDSSRRIWAGTYQQGVALFDGETWRRISKESSAGMIIHALFEDSLRRVWIAADEGISVSDGTDFRIYRTAAEQPLTGVRCFAENRGAIWLGDSFQRLHRFQDGTFHEVIPSGDSFGATLRTMLAEPDGTIWIGTAGAGLGCLRNGTYVRLSKRDSRCPKRIGSMLLDDTGHFWLGTEQGIVRVERAELLAVVEGRQQRAWWDIFDSKDYDTLTTDFATVSASGGARDRLGRFWFGSIKGVSVIDPKRVHLDSKPPLVKVERVSFMDKANVTHTLALDPAERLTLPPGSHNIEIQFTALSFIAPTKIMFSTRLTRDGEEFNSWEGDKRSSFFNWLPPGTYEFHVNAATQQGNWSTSGDAVSFGVLPAYWQTEWFRLLGLAASILVPLAVVSGVMHSRHRRAEEKMKEQQRAEKRLMEEQECRLRAEQEARSLSQRLLSAHETERSRIARELHDDITQRLARLAIDAAYVERGGASDVSYRTIREDLGQLSEDVHQLAYRLHPAILDDLGLLDALRAECDRFAREQSVKVQVKSRDVPNDIRPETALALFRVAQEALRNIARHARAKSVEVSLAGLDGGLQLAVRDDGIGFDHARSNGFTLGHAGMRERVSLVNGELDIESTPGFGTTIVAWVPLKGVKS